MYYPDLSQSPRHPVDERIVLLNVGWLDGAHPFPQGEVSEMFLARLWIFCANPPWYTMGYHLCELCPRPPLVTTVARGHETLRLGSSEIRVMGKRNQWYAAPNLIYHYVIDHHYLPPTEFLHAILTSPLPFEKRYRARSHQISPARPWSATEQHTRDRGESDPPTQNRLKRWFNSWARHRGNSTD